MKVLATLFLLLFMTPAARAERTHTREEELAHELSHAISIGAPQKVEEFFNEHPEASAELPWLSYDYVPMPRESDGKSQSIAEITLTQHETLRFHEILSETPGSEPLSDDLKILALENREQILAQLETHGANLQAIHQKIEEQYVEALKKEKSSASRKIPNAHSPDQLKQAWDRLDAEFNQFISEIHKTASKKKPTPPSQQKSSNAFVPAPIDESCALALFAPSLKEAYQLALTNHEQHNPTGEIRQDFSHDQDSNCFLSFAFKSRMRTEGQGKEKRNALLIFDVQLKNITDLRDKNLGSEQIIQTMASPSESAKTPQGQSAK